MREEIEGLAQEFVPSLPIAEVRATANCILRQVQQDRRYRLKSERLVELLDVQPDEQAKLQILISDDLRAERTRERDRQRNRKGDGDREEYLRQVQERRDTARLLRSQGMPYKAIAEQMGLTVKQVENLLYNAKRAGY